MLPSLSRAKAATRSIGARATTMRLPPRPSKCGIVPAAPALLAAVPATQFGAGVGARRAGSSIASAGYLVDLNTIESKTARASLVSSGLMSAWTATHSSLVSSGWAGEWYWATQNIARWPFRSTTR